jgi:hypothetical protein
VYAGIDRRIVRGAAGSLAVSIAFVALTPGMRSLITDKAGTLPVEAATLVPIA